MRILRTGLLCLLAIRLLPAAEDLVKPDKLPISTWVREDLFAGWIMNDGDTFDRGERKLDRFLQDHPDGALGLSWKYFALGYRTRQALEKGDRAAYRGYAAAAKSVREKIFAGDPKDPGPYIIVGSTLVGLAYFVPQEERAWTYRDGRELLRKVPELQAKYFNTLPAHFRGEIWTQIAFASDRLGDTAERDRMLDEITSNLRGTPYEARARAWKKGPALAAEKQYTCISCHEPGRLAPTLSRLNAPAPR